MGRKKVLVIEDNPLNMKLVRVLLGLGDYEVLEAPDAEKGLPLALLPVSSGWVGRT
jgi:CheY-like chemotaxis protein